MVAKTGDNAVKHMRQRCVTMIANRAELAGAIRDEMNRL